MGTGGLRLFPPEISCMEIRGFARFINKQNTKHTQMITLLEKESESRNESDF